MGELVLVRVDERLIHGVICVTWAPNVNADTIIAVDDITANDDFVKSIMKSSAAGASGLNADILTIDNAVSSWKEKGLTEGRILLIFKSVEDAFKAYEKGLDYMSLQLGWTNPKKGRERIDQSLCLSKEDVDLVRKLEKDYSVKVNMQYSPQFEPVSFEDGIKGKF